MKKTRKPKALKFEGLESRVALSANEVITKEDVGLLLDRASAASRSTDAIIAVVDRGGRILGVRTEASIHGDENYLVFAIDGAVAKARTAAFFSSNEAPLTSRTVQFISQSTVTQREVEANPNITDPDSTIRGPGFVAPIGLGGLFPPGINHTPIVDLFGIEHTNRDSVIHPGANGVKTMDNHIDLDGRFNIDKKYVPEGQKIEAPESYGFQSGYNIYAQSRGIATLPGGIPLYKNNVLVGGIGVFFPGSLGYATFEQGFQANKKQTQLQRLNASRELEAEWIALAATNGSSKAKASVGVINGVPKVPGYDLPAGRIDLAGITLTSVGPIAGPNGVKVIQNVGKNVMRGGAISGSIQRVTPVFNPLDPYLQGTPVPEGWLVTAHDGASLSGAQVEQIINQGVAEAQQVRAQIRLPIGKRTEMVLAVADTDGSVLGLYRMPDATVFSLDVAVAKARNTVYYASPELQPEDRIVDKPGQPSSVPIGTALTNRTFRFVAEARYPSGVPNSLAGAFSILREAGINPKTAENIGPPKPSSSFNTVLGFDAFTPGRNFRDPSNIDNQNGVVFFPGSTPLYSNTALVAGFGVSGDGVDQDDVVTFYGAAGFQAPEAIRADRYFVRDVRLPYYKFPRNPHA